MKILLIEPDTVLADLYGQALRRTGHQITRTADAQVAIHTADDNLPDLVILELQLARHNGVEFLYEFRSYPEWAEVPVILVSTVPSSSLNSQLQASLGIVAYHYKPQTTLQQLLRSVERVALSGSNRRR